jgi:hypothetical protein
MVNATHLNATYCEHEREHVRQYRRVVSLVPSGPIQAGLSKQTATFAHPSSYNRKAATIGLAATGQIDLYA